MDNRKSYLGSITKYSKIGEGSFSFIYKVDYLDAFFAYKEFLDPKYVKFIGNRLHKLSKFFYEETSLVFPYEFIYKYPNDEYFCGYVIDYLENYDKVSDIQYKDENSKIMILKKCRELVDKFHNKYNSIHTDIAPWNFLYNEDSDKVKLIDFDSYINLNNKEKYLSDYYSIFAQDYGNCVGIDKDLDIFLFNLMTYSLLTDSDYNRSLENINANKLDYFKSENVNKIFNSYKNLDCKKCLKKEYVIDYL